VAVEPGDAVGVGIREEAKLDRNVDQGQHQSFQRVGAVQRPYDALELVADPGAAFVSSGREADRECDCDSQLSCPIVAFDPTGPRRHYGIGFQGSIESRHSSILLRWQFAVPRLFPGNGQPG
jgi:hypothetical protein